MLHNESRGSEPGQQEYILSREVIQSDLTRKGIFSRGYFSKTLQAIHLEFNSSTIGKGKLDEPEKRL